MPRKTKEEAMKTRAGIMKAAEQFFFEKGVISTSLQEIAIRAGATRGAVYWHFRDKADLLRAISEDEFKVHEDLMSRLIAAGQDEPLTHLLQCCKESLHAMVNDTRRRRVFTILTKRCEYIEEMQPLLAHNQKCRELLMEQLTQIFAQAARKGQLAPCWAPATAALALQSMLYGFVTTEMEWSRPSAARDRDRTEALTAFFAALRG